MLKNHRINDLKLTQTPNPSFQTCSNQGKKSKLNVKDLKKQKDVPHPETEQKETEKPLPLLVKIEVVVGAVGEGVVVMVVNSKCLMSQSPIILS